MSAQLRAGRRAFGPAASASRRCFSSSSSSSASASSSSSSSTATAERSPPHYHSAARRLQMGGYRDVFKHTVLSRVMPELGNSNVPWTYVDFFAGKGRYDSWQQRKTEQWEGVERAMRYNPLVTEPVAPLIEYIDNVASFDRNSRAVMYPSEAKIHRANAYNDKGQLMPRFLPGNWDIAQQYMTERDRMVLVEECEEEFSQLKARVGHDWRYKLYNEDPEQLLEAVLPPRTANGVVVYDAGLQRLVGEDLKRMERMVEMGGQLAPELLHVVMYPIEDEDRPVSLLNAARNTGIRNIVSTELYSRAAGDKGRSGMGVVAMNMPVEYFPEMQEVTPFMHKVLGTQHWQLLDGEYGKVEVESAGMLEQIKTVYEQARAAEQLTPELQNFRLDIEQQRKAKEESLGGLDLMGINEISEQNIREKEYRPPVITPNDLVKAEQDMHFMRTQRRLNTLLREKYPDQMEKLDEDRRAQRRELATAMVAAELDETPDAARDRRFTTRARLDRVDLDLALERRGVPKGAMAAMSMGDAYDPAEQLTTHSGALGWYVDDTVDVVAWAQAKQKLAEGSTEEWVKTYAEEADKHLELYHARYAAAQFPLRVNQDVVHLVERSFALLAGEAPAVVSEDMQDNVTLSGTAVKYQYLPSALAAQLKQMESADEATLDALEAQANSLETVPKDMDVLDLSVPVQLDEEVQALRELRIQEVMEDIEAEESDGVRGLEEEDRLEPDDIADLNEPAVIRAGLHMLTREDHERAKQEAHQEAVELLDGVHREILKEQGFTDEVLRSKLDDLEANPENGETAKWLEKEGIDRGDFVLQSRHMLKLPLAQEQVSEMVLQTKMEARGQLSKAMADKVVEPSIFLRLQAEAEAAWFTQDNLHTAEEMLAGPQEDAEAKADWANAVALAEPQLQKLNETRENGGMDDVAYANAAMDAVVAQTEASRTFDQRMKEFLQELEQDEHKLAYEQELEAVTNINYEAQLQQRMDVMGMDDMAGRKAEVLVGKDDLAAQEAIAPFDQPDPEEETDWPEQEQQIMAQPPSYVGKDAQQEDARARREHEADLKIIKATDRKRLAQAAKNAKGLVDADMLTDAERALDQVVEMARQRGDGGVLGMADPEAFVFSGKGKKSEAEEVLKARLRKERALDGRPAVRTAAQQLEDDQLRAAAEAQNFEPEDVGAGGLVDGHFGGSSSSTIASQLDHLGRYEAAEAQEDAAADYWNWTAEEEGDKEEKLQLREEKRQASAERGGRPSPDDESDYEWPSFAEVATQGIPTANAIFDMEDDEIGSPMMNGINEPYDVFYFRDHGCKPLGIPPLVAWVSEPPRKNYENQLEFSFQHVNSKDILPHMLEARRKVMHRFHLNEYKNLANRNAYQELLANFDKTADLRALRSPFPHPFDKIKGNPHPAPHTVAQLAAWKRRILEAEDREAQEDVIIVMGMKGARSHGRRNKKRRAL